MSTVRTSGGDYHHEDLEAAMNRGALIGDLYDQWSKHPRQRTVAFAVSVAHSLAIVDAFRAHGVRAEHLDGNTPEIERRAILARLERNETELVSNVGVLCEGWDMPSCKTLILARPTKSLALYMQMAGRILRPFTDPIVRGAVSPLVLDHGGNVDRHGLPHEDREWGLDARAKRGSGAPPVKACPSCFAFIAAGLRVCPHCRHAFESSAPDPSQAKEPVIVDLALRTLDGDDARLAFFRALHKKCRERGWKFGAVIHRFEERFGEPPPAHWIAALKSDYRADGEWKRRAKERQAERRDADHAAYLNGAVA
jgi:superfamily II DNA or RNA helicase